MAILLALITVVQSTNAQLKLSQDTISCVVVGANFGVMMPDGKHSSDNGMHDLYKSPFLNYGMETFYKFKSNTLLSIDGFLSIGSDNLRFREQRMSNVYTHDPEPIVIGSGGIAAGVECFNRGLYLRCGAGKIFKISRKNINSGILLRINCGIVQQKTIFVANNDKALQLDGDYAKLYDHKRRGLNLAEGIGFWYMSNNYNFVNFHVEFEVAQNFTHSVRKYMIDDYMGLRGKDNAKYFDLTYNVRISWMIPLRGNRDYDFYFD